MTLASLRHGALALAHRAGVDDLMAQSPWRRRRLLILCYHGVALHDEDQWHPELYFPQALFRRRMELLCASGATVLPLDEALQRLAAHDLPEQAVALTFDDGMYNFHAAALPILLELGLPTTVYLTTYHMVHQRPIFGLAASYLLWCARRSRLAPWPAVGLHQESALTSDSERRSVVNAIAAQADAAGLAGSARDELLHELATRLEVEDAAIRTGRRLHVMNASEVSEVAQAGIDVQLHTHRHRAPVDRSAFRREIQDNARCIDDVTGRQARHFCYPSGRYALAHLPWLREEGVVSATTCDVALASPEDEPLLLPRFVDTPLQPESTFLSWVGGTAGLLNQGRAHRAEQGPSMERQA